MIVVDARAEDFFDGHLLPNAKRLPHYSSDETIAEVLPERIGTFVVYCGGIECPASKILSTRLVELGYVTVFDYAEGIPALITSAGGSSGTSTGASPLAAGASDGIST